jgi:hypothetical protein
VLLSMHDSLRKVRIPTLRWSIAGDSQRGACCAIADIRNGTFVGLIECSEAELMVAFSTPKGVGRMSILHAPE